MPIRLALTMEPAPVTAVAVSAHDTLVALLLDAYASLPLASLEWTLTNTANRYKYELTTTDARTWKQDVDFDGTFTATGVPDPKMSFETGGPSGWRQHGEFARLRAVRDQLVRMTHDGQLTRCEATWQVVP